MLGDPGGGQDVFVDALVPRRGPASYDGFIRIGDAGKRHHPYGRGEKRRSPPALRHGGNTVRLEQDTPLVRPEGDVLHRTRNVGLGIAETLEHGVLIGHQVMQQVGMAADAEAKHGGVADALTWLRPVLHDDVCKLRFELEEAIQGPGHHNVQVQVQPVALHTGQLVVPEGNLAPSPVIVGRRDRHRGAVHAFNFGSDAFLPVGHADESERRRDMTRDHAIELVDVMGRVFVTPFHAYDLFHGTGIPLNDVPGGSDQVWAREKG